MNKLDKNILPPRQDLDFFELFDYFWDNGLGNFLDTHGNTRAWDADALSDKMKEVGLRVSPRALDNWKSHSSLPSRRFVRGLARIASGGDEGLLQEWADVLWRTHRDKKGKRNKEQNQSSLIQRILNNFELFKLRWLAAFLMLFCVFSVAVFLLQNTLPQVNNIRICDKFHFNNVIKKCDEHISVFVHGIDDVYLSFDFKNVPKDMAFERWWIHNSERVAGRTSFNDEAWPGWTFWRPGKLKIGQYVVRVVVDGRVFTQTFYVQKEGFIER